MQRKKLVGLSKRFWAGVILFPKQLALSGDFLLVTAFWGDGRHWYLVSKGQGCYCTPENGFLKTVQCTGQRPPPPHTKNDPAQIVNGAKDKKKQCMSSPPGTFVSSPNPPHSATQAFPSPAPAPHPTLLILSLSPSHQSSPATGPERQSLGKWPGKRAYTERKSPLMPERCGFQLGCQR